MKKNLEEIATRIAELENECEKGINISENMKEMTRLMYCVSFEDLFQLNEIIERKFS